MAKGRTNNYIMAGIAIVGSYVGMELLARKYSEQEDFNYDNSYLKMDTDIRDDSYSLYESVIKKNLDKIFSFIGLIALSPLFCFISLIIIIDDPGPIFFTQKRVGKNKEFFQLHKFRSMRMNAPHNVPTHQLTEPNRYITRVGRVLRKTSMDELPQIWDVFRGKMSMIGPRPALWNQEDLVAERDLYRVNGLIPGLTGWAQINGRDELEIPAKAKLDGEYAKKMRTGGMVALLFDIRCLFNTILSIFKANGVVEGGTGQIKNQKKENSTDGSK